MNKQPTTHMTHLTPLLPPDDSSPPVLALEPTNTTTDHAHDHHHSSNHQQLQTQHNPSSKSNEGLKTLKGSCSETSHAVHEELADKEATKAEGFPDAAAVAEDNGRERLKRHRSEVAGRVWIPDIWGQEEMLKDWIDCAAFDASLVSSNIMSARAALALEGRRATSGRLRIENRC